MLPAEALRPLRLGAIACEYAARGFATFPTTWIKTDLTCSCGDTDCTSPGKHPLITGGFEGASLDEATILKWWKRWPEANIAIATGQVSNLVVLDIDVKDGGLPTWEAWQEDETHIDAATVQTGGGGLHLYFSHPGEPITNRQHMRPGIDFRGDGGYVIAPPSMHESGQRYDWRVEFDPEMVRDTVMPAWLETEIRTKKEAVAAIAPDFETPLDDWDHECPDVVTELVSQYRNLRLLFQRDKRTKLEGGDASKVDYMIACRLYEYGVSDPATISHALMYSRWKYDPDAWLVMSRKSNRYFETTTAKAINKVEEQRAEALNLKNSMHHAWRKDFDPNERGDSHRFNLIHGPDLLYHTIESRWLTYDGARYAGDESKLGGSHGINNRIFTFLDDMKKAARLQPTPEASDAWLKRATKSGTPGHARGIEYFMRVHRPVWEEQLDTNPMLLNCANGVVDLETGELELHDRELKLSMMCTAPYVPGISSKRWLSFLEQAIPDPETREFFGLCIGYSILGTQPDRRFFFAHGPGGTGKSTMIKAISGALGSYHRSADFQSFLEQRGRHSNAPSSDMARLMRIRMVSAVEVGHGQQLNTGLIKKLSGGDAHVARKLYGDEQEFTPVMALWFVANDRPKGRVDDDALWDRLVPFEFGQRVERAGQDTRLLEKLGMPAERAGILAWCVDQARRYLRVGKLVLPPECERGVRSYKQHSNPLSEFIEEQVVFEGLSQAARALVFERYRTWCRENDQKVIGKKAFFAAMRADDRVRELHDTAGIVVWRGLRLGSGV